MAIGLRLLGFLLLVTIVTGGSHIPEVSNTIEDLADIQKDLYLKTVELFNASVTGQLTRFISQLQALEARIDEVETRFQDFTAETGNENEVKKAGVPLEISTPEVTRPTPKKPKTRRTTTTRAPTTTTSPPTTTVPPTTTTPTTTQPPTTTPMPPPPTCAELARRGETVSGTYLIDPMMSGNAFYVECELPAGVTSIGHYDVDREILNNGNENPASFQFAPEYRATIQQMKALTAASQNCSQFISYRCKGAVLLAEDKKTRMRYGYWVSVDGEQIISWGGTPVNSKQCACALTSNGCLQDRPCNCDSNPKTFAVDEGLLTDKPYLPVTSVYLGDTGSKKELGYLSLGPLRCQ